MSASTAYGTPPSCPPPSMCTSGPPTSGPVDTQAPTAPGKPVVTVANGVATVSWAASTDNVGVVSYQIVHQWTDIVELVTVAAPSTSRSFTIGTSDTQHIFSVTAKDAAGNISASSGQTSIGTPPTCPVLTICTTSPPTSSAPPTSSGVSCAVTYTIQSTWPGGFQAEIRIRNTGTVPIDPWSLIFNFPNGQQISQIWNATRTQSGSTVTAAGLSWNRLIPPGGSASFGFIGTWTGTNAPPTLFTVNGTPCTSADQAQSRWAARRAPPAGQRGLTSARSTRLAP
ncbi:cellulose binding domain-containing protein [Luedemannella flava]